MSKFFYSFIWIDEQLLQKSYFANFKSGGMYFIFENYAQYLLTPLDVNSQNTAISLKPINFIDTTKLILYPKVRNSMSQLTIISGISKIAFPFFLAQTTSNYSQMYLTKTTNKRRPRLSNYLPCVWV